MGWGGSGGGVADGVGTLVKVDTVLQDELDVSSTAPNPDDVAASAVFLPDGSRTPALHIIGEVDPLLTSQLGVKNATGGGVAKLRASDGAVLDGNGNPVISGSAPTIATSTAVGVVKGAGDITVNGTTGNVTVPALATKRNTTDPVPWADISGAPGGISSPRIDDDLTSLTFNTTAVETTFAELIIPAGDALTGDEYEFEISGDLLNNSGSSVTANLKLYWGGQVAATGAQNLSSLATRRAFRMRSRLIIRGTADQAYGAELITSTGASGTWVPLLAALTTISSGLTTADMTVALHVKLTCTFSVSNALVEGRRFYALLNRRRP